MEGTALIIGAGVMGRGIAQSVAGAGFHTLLYDLDKAQVARALAAIAADLDKGARSGKISAQPVRETLERIEAVTDLRASAARADVAIEAVVERIDVKLDVFRLLDQAAPRDCLLATNTSALSVTELGSALSTPSRMVGLHFFNPVPRMALVEIVRGLDTSAETVRRALEFVENIGEQPVVVQDSPGFAVSRINAMIGNEAFFMLMEGVASAEDIDTAMKLGLNHPMGPFELGDLVGWDVRLKVLEHLHRTLGDKFRPCPLLVQYVAAGHLGRKTGRGVFIYHDHPTGNDPAQVPSSPTHQAKEQIHGLLDP